MKKLFLLTLLGAAALGTIPSIVMGAQQTPDTSSSTVNIGKIHHFKITAFDDLEKINFSTIGTEDPLKIIVDCNTNCVRKYEYPNLLKDVLTSIQSLKNPIFFHFSFDPRLDYKEREGEKHLTSVIEKMESLKTLNLKSLSLKTPGRYESNIVLNQFFQTFPSLPIETLEIEGTSYLSEIDYFSQKIDGLQITNWLEKNPQIQNLSLEFEDDCAPFLNSLETICPDLNSLSLALRSFNSKVLASLRDLKIKELNLKADDLPQDPEISKTLKTLPHLKRLSFDDKVELNPETLSFFEGLHLEGLSLKPIKGKITPETRDEIELLKSQIGKILSNPNFDQQNIKNDLDDITQYISGLLDQRLELENEYEKASDWVYYDDSDDDDDFAFNEKKEGKIYPVTRNLLEEIKEEIQNIDSKLEEARNDRFDIAKDYWHLQGLRRSIKSLENKQEEDFWQNLSRLSSQQKTINLKLESGLEPHTFSELRDSPLASSLKCPTTFEECQITGFTQCSFGGKLINNGILTLLNNSEDEIFHLKQASPAETPNIFSYEAELGTFGLNVEFNSLENPRWVESIHLKSFTPKN